MTGPCRDPMISYACIMVVGKSPGDEVKPSREQLVVEVDNGSRMPCSIFFLGTKEMMYMKVATEEINSHIHKWL
jgi:hypothetical protein